MENAVIRDIGLRLAAARKRTGYTQEQLANMTGLSIKMLSAAENGHKAMRPENIVRICESLSISTDYLLKGELIGTDGIADQNKLNKLTSKQREALINIVNDFFSAFDD